MKMIEDEESEVPHSAERKIPRILYLVYAVVLIWGAWAYMKYFNGAEGFKRNVWEELQEAAGTRFN